MALKLASLSTRDKAKKIAREAERKGRGEIDLTGVEFVSRSFADELIKQADERDLEIVGVDDEVAKMLDVVRA